MKSKLFKSNLFFILFAATLTLFWSGQVWAFGTGGIVTTAIGSVAYANSVIVQPDGKLVAAGSGNNGTNNNFALARYNNDGSLDTSFGSGGIVLTPVGDGNNWASAVIIQPDGKLVAAGQSYTGGKWNFALARYNSDGSLDTSFGSGGMVISSVSSLDDGISSLVLQPDGKLVAGGDSGVGNTWGTHTFTLARYHSDGSLDTSFGAGGIVHTSVGGGVYSCSSLVIQTDGKLVAAGQGGSDPFYFALVRYNTDGSLDASFGSGGIVNTYVYGEYGKASSVILQPDGKLVAAGDNYNYPGSNFVLVRYNSNGSLDTTFGSGGIVTTAFTGNDFACSVIVQVDGKLVATGQSYTGSKWNCALARYHSDGSLDASFGTGGKVVTSVGGGDTLPHSLALQLDAKLVVAGQSFIGSIGEFTLIRYDSDGSLDVAVPTLTPTPSWTPTVTPTDSPTTTATPTLTLTASPTTTATPTFTSSFTPTETSTTTPTSTPTPLAPQCVHAWPQHGHFMYSGESQKILAISKYRHWPQPNILIHYRVLHGHGRFGDQIEAYGQTGAHAEPAQAIFTAASMEFNVNLIKVDNLGLGGRRYLVIVEIPKCHHGHKKCWKCHVRDKMNREQDESAYLFDEESKAQVKVASIEAACPHEKTATPTSTPTNTPTASPTQSATPLVMSTAANTAVVTQISTCTTTATSTRTPRLDLGLGDMQTILYPNPAKGQVNFAYSVPGAAKVEIDIYLINGERVAHIIDCKNGGSGQTQSTTWEAAGVAPGVYFCQIRIFSSEGRLLLDQKKKVALIQ